MGCNQTWSQSTPLGSGSSSSGNGCWQEAVGQQQRWQLQLWRQHHQAISGGMQQCRFSCIWGSTVFCGSNTQNEDLQATSGWQQRNQRQQQWR
ncbi:Hypothetical predicted protein, partial [Marmota monax]